MATSSAAKFAEKYGPWAVVAGASEGLGEAFARQLAARGVNVVLVARRADALAALAASIAAESKASVRVVALDLASPELVAPLAAALEGLEVGLYVHNAAFSPVGEFLTVATADHLKALAVNTRAPVLLAHHFGQAMAARGRGGIVLLSSLTAFQGSPFLATYGATKAFNLSLAEALWFELRPRGVDVLAVCAGATRTPNFLRTMPGGAPGMLEPAAVARDALDRLGRAPLTIAGRFNRVASFFMRRVLPRRLMIAIMGDQGRKLRG